MAAHFNGRNGTETLFCDVHVVLKNAAFLHQLVVRGEAFGSKYKPYFTLEMAEEFTEMFSEQHSLFFRYFWSNCRL